jgi:hypothetical protein
MNSLNLINLTFGGSWNGHYIRYLAINVYNCQNTTDNQCKSAEEITNFIIGREIYFSFYTNFYSVDLSDQITPLKVSNGIYYASLDNKILKTIKFYYKIGKVLQDKGIIFKSITNY